MSISAAIVVVAGIIYIRETFAPVILQKKAARIYGTPTQSSSKELFSKIYISLQRPVRLLIFRPVIQMLAFALAVSFGIYILVLSFFAQVFTNQYHQDATDSSLHYIAIGLGITLAAKVGGQVMDIIYRYLQRRQPADSPPPPPESRILLFLIGSAMGPIGLFWLGWSTQARIAWIMIDIGAAIFTFGSFVGGQAISAYLLDEFSGNAASAMAAVRMLSNVFGFAFPLFAPQLFDRLGYGWGNSVLGFVWIAVLFPVPAFLWFGGEEIRALGREGKNPDS